MVFFHALILTAVQNCKNWERIKTDLQQPWPRLMWKPMKTVLSFVPTNHIWDNKKNMAAPMLKKKNLVKTVFSKVLCPLTCQPQIPTPDLLVADSDARPVNPRSWYPTWQPQIGPISQSQIVIPDQTTPDNLALVCQPPKSREVGGVQYAPDWSNLISENLVNCYAKITSQLFQRRKIRRFWLLKLSNFGYSAATL